MSTEMMESLAEDERVTLPQRGRDDLLSNVKQKPQLISHFNVKSNTRGLMRTQPTGITITPSGNYVVADHEEKKVKIFNFSGKLKKELGREVLRTPWDVAMLHNGNAVVTDPGDRKVKIFDPNGELVRSFSCCEGMTEPYGVTVNGRGQILVADYIAKAICIHSPDGERLGWIKPQAGARSLMRPEYICTDDKGNIIISDSGTNVVQCINTSGERVWVYGGDHGLMPLPHGVCVDNGGHIIIADGGNNRIHIASSNGYFLKTLLSNADQVTKPLAVCIDNSLNLVLTEGFTGEAKTYSYLT